MNDLLKQLGEVEINLKLLEARKTALVRQLLEQLKNESTSAAKDGEASQASGETKDASTHQS